MVGLIESLMTLQRAQHVRLNPHDLSDGTRIYNLQGVLYFGSVREFAERYRKAGKRLRLRHLNLECQKMITSAGKLIVIEVAEDDPHYSVVSI